MENDERDPEPVNRFTLPNESRTSSSSSCDTAGGEDDAPLLELGGTPPGESCENVGGVFESFKSGWGSSEMAACMVAKAASSCATFSLSSSTSAAALSLR